MVLILTLLDRDFSDYLEPFFSRYLTGFLTLNGGFSDYLTVNSHIITITIAATCSLLGTRLQGEPLK